MYTIYKHTNLVNGKAYIGYTSLTMEERWKQHVSLSLQPSKATRKIKLWNAIRKYGPDLWGHEILLETKTQADAKATEIKLIEDYNTFRWGYNMTIGGEGTCGFKHTNVSKQVMSKLKVGRYEGCNNPMFGRKHTEGSKNKNRLSNLGQKRSVDVRNHLSDITSGINNPFFGKTHSAEARKKISAAVKKRRRVG